MHLKNLKNIQEILNTKCPLCNSNLGVITSFNNDESIVLQNNLIYLFRLKELSFSIDTITNEISNISKDRYSPSGELAYVNTINLTNTCQSCFDNGTNIKISYTVFGKTKAKVEFNSLVICFLKNNSYYTLSILQHMNYFYFNDQMGESENFDISSKQIIIDQIEQHLLFK